MPISIPPAPEFVSSLTLRNEIDNNARIRGESASEPRDEVDGRRSTSSLDDGGINPSASGLMAPGVASSFVGGQFSTMAEAAIAASSLPYNENVYSRHGQSLESVGSEIQRIKELASHSNQRLEDGSEGIREWSQTQSQSATLIRESLRFLSQRGGFQVNQLRSKASEVYRNLISEQPNGDLRRSMIVSGLADIALFDQNSLDGWEALSQEVAPSASPINAWLADGKNEINISMVAGRGESFITGLADFAVAEAGFRVASSESNGEKVLERQAFAQGREITLRIKISEYRENTFTDINNPDTDIIAYLGHSNLGLNTWNALENAPPDSGSDKFIFLGLCAGKDVLDDVRKSFPESQVMTTFNSSYFNYVDPKAENKVFSEGEDIKAFFHSLAGMLNNHSWADIRASIRRGGSYMPHNVAKGATDNYITPDQLLLSRRFADLDRDGVSDVLDRYFNVGTVVAESNIAAEDLRELSQDIESIGKTYAATMHKVALSINTLELYNDSLTAFAGQGLVRGGGFFKRESTSENAGAIRFTKGNDDAGEVFVMTVDERFAHLNFETLRAIAMVEYNDFIAANSPSSYPHRSETERELAGLVAAAASIKYSGLNSSQEYQVWQSVLEYSGQPPYEWMDLKMQMILAGDNASHIEIVNALSRKFGV